MPFYDTQILTILYFDKLLKVKQRIYLENIGQ